MVVSFITLSVYAAALMAFVRMVVLLSRPGEISTHGADGANQDKNEGGESP